MAFSNSYDTVNTGSAVSNREDLTDILTTLAPTETPILSLSSKRKAKATYHEFTVDDLDDPDTDGVHEGADISAFQDKYENRARHGNYVQGFQRSWMVSQVQEAVESVGPAGVAQAKVKSMRELKRDVEAMIVSDNDRVAGSGSAKPKSRGLGDWLDSAGPSDVDPNYRTPSDQISTAGTSFTEANMQTMLASMYDVSGNNSNVTLIADTALRNTIANFTRLEGTTNLTAQAVQVYNQKPKQVSLAVDLFISDFGTVKIANSNPKCSPVAGGAKDRGYFVNFDFIHVAELIPMRSVEIDNKGGGERGYCECWLTLAPHDPRAHGKIS